MCGRQKERKKERERERERERGGGRERERCTYIHRGLKPNIILCLKINGLLDKYNYETIAPNPPDN